MMRFISVLKRLWREERGITAALMALFMTGLVGMSAVAVDVGVMYTAKAQLQNAADSAALAAADTMLGMDAQNNAIAQPSTGLGSAQQYSAANKAIGVSVALKTPPGSDFTIGYYNTSTGAFDSNRTGLGLTNSRDLNAVQVTLRRDNQANTPVSTYFAKVMGIDEINVSATTVAFRGYPATVPTGTVQLPIVIIGESILGGDGCPTCDKTKPLDAVAGWTSFTTYPNNSTTVVDYLNGHSAIPDVKVGDIVYLNGDSISNSYFSNAYNYVKALYNENGVDTTGDHKADYWEVVLPVVKQVVSASNEGQPWAQRALAKMRGLFIVQPAYACGPTTGHQVSGFVTVKLTKLNNSDHSKASATVICDVVQPGSTTGGGDFGSRAATAKLIR